MRGVQLLVRLLFCFGTGTAWGTTIIGAGSYYPAQVFNEALFAYRFANPNVDIQYYSSESSAGICRIESAQNECDPSDTRAPSNLDFAASTAILNQSDYAKYPDLQMYPVLATSIVPIYNLNGIKGLILTRTVLAQIFSGQITTWDDSRIANSNANFSQWKIPAKQKIEVVVRQEATDTTSVFKNALFDFWTSFANYVEVSGQPNWGNTTVTKLNGYAAVNGYVLLYPWTISYSVLEYAINAKVAYALINKGSSIVVEASLKSTTFALLEMGLNFGNNGDNTTHLTADLSNARGVNAWPIVTYTYVVLRKSTLREGATCRNVHETVAFWQWFLMAAVVQSIAEAHYFVQLPSVVRDIVVQRLVTDVTCLNQLVFEAAKVLQVAAAGETSLVQIFQELSEVYAEDKPQVSLQYASGLLNTTDAVAAALLTNQFVAVREPRLAPASSTATLLFAGVALVVITQYTLVLDLPTLVRILEGNITTWQHPDIAALNPAGIKDSSGNNITNVTTRIILLNGPTSSSPSFQGLMQAYVPGFVGAALQAAPRLYTEEQLQIVVSGFGFTLAVTMSSTESSSRTKFASLRRPEGNVVAPTAQAIFACASSSTYSATDGLDLSTSTSDACYPLSDAVYLIVRMPLCTNTSADSVDSQAIGFLQWVLQANATGAAMQGQGVALLAAVSPAVQAANSLALSSLQCIAPDASGGSSTNIVPIIAGVCVGVLFLIAIPIGWYVWKSRRDMRALRKQFSDVKVAEDCAEAIACFDLEAVSWLSTLTKPSKIQLAFLQIVSLLVEVKPFIPDQLMAQLQAAKRGDELPKADPEQPVARQDSADEHTLATTQSMRSITNSLHSGPSSILPHIDSSKQMNAKQHTIASEDSAGPRKVGRSGRMRHNSQGGGPMLDRYRRTCTYMFVRFMMVSDPEEDKLGQLATTLAAHVVTLGKAHGATIDKVTYDSVALHWNVSVQSAGAPLQATALAMELACAAQILPAAVQGDLRLLVGIGHGQSTVATVSAAGQRFFVVGGPEITNAVEVVMREAAVPLGCTVLLSNAVQQEVKYGFRCSPRLWFRNVLFWEPMEQRGGCKFDDEWMYQIRKMEENDTSMDVGRAMHDVFVLARSGQSGGVLQREIRHVQQTFADSLTPQDQASLRHLQDSAGAPHTPLIVSAF